MRFTPSKDGLRRTTMRIDFRVSVSTLHAAAADAIWTKLLDARVDEDEARDTLADELAAKLTRSEVIDEARKSLKANGYAGGGTDDDFWQIAYEAAEAVVWRLWRQEKYAWDQATKKAVA